jgi:hypothetical protein
VTSAEDECLACGTVRALCVCDRIVVHESRVRVCVLQHPFERDTSINSARIVWRTLPASTRVVPGVAWPTWQAALGAGSPRASWAVVYPSQLPRPLRADERSAPFVLMSRQGAPVETASISGLVVLDGTWSQAKSMWWRNPWLLRLSRIVLHPREPSIYGRIRAEPKREYLSTLEAVADALVGLGEPEILRSDLRRAFRTLVQRARDLGRPV